MSDVAIKVENLSKHYRLGAGPAGRGDFREVAGNLARAAARRLRGDRGEAEDVRDLWALRDVSFDVKRGEVVGLIGHNGAGKSTLLKILSRITDPTSGHAWFEGRVGSLLEVGTGFHPELSGRENIYLNGAILGMTRAEVKAKFDEIVEFSEIGRFLDTPVKRYSSGMYVRLAFSVAAHLEPEVLIVDEVLAVGDANFQRKCMGKMKDVAGGGRTILFVSHNMGSIQTLCDRAVVLKAGQVIGEGEPEDAVKLYMAAIADDSDKDLAERDDRLGRGGARFTAARIHTAGHDDADELLIFGKDAVAEFEADRFVPNMVCKFTIHDRHRNNVARFSSKAAAPDDGHADPAPDGRPRFVCEIPNLPLVPGDYSVTASLNSGPELEDRVRSILTFKVEYGVMHGRAFDPAQKDTILVPKHRWLVPRA